MRCWRCCGNDIPSKSSNSTRKGSGSEPHRVSQQPPSGGCAAPGRRDQIIEHFVQSLGQTMDLSLGQETWDDAQSRLLPLLKPRSYVDSDSASRYSLVNEWLADVVICYALRSKDIFRFVTTADADRWQTDAQAIHQVAIANLCRLAWPTKLEGARQRDGGCVIVIATGDGLASSRLLHPGLHRLCSGPLGSPFRAGIPDRDTLVVFRPAPPQAADPAPVAQGSSHVELSHYPPVLSCNARRHRTAPA